MFSTLLVKRSLVLGSFRPVSLASLRQPQTQTLCASRLHTLSYVVKMSTLAHSRSRPRSPSPEPITKRARRDLHQSKEQHRPRSPSTSSTKHEGESSYDSSAPFPSSPPSSVDMAIESTNGTTSSSSAGASQQPRLLVQLDPAHPKAKTPTRGSALAAGYDLYASDDVVIPKSGGRKVVPTGIRLAIPPECYGRVAPRSGLASKHGIDVGAGVIDADYRGLLGVLLFNFGTEDFTINAGDRIAQLVLERVMLAEVETVESLDETVRGVGGFGSTGGFGKPASS